MGHRANPEPAPRPQPGTPHLHAGGPRPRRVSRQKAGPAARRGARIHAETSCRAPNPHPTGRQCPCPVGHASTATPHRPPRLCRDRHYPPGRISWPPLRPVFYASDAPVKAASRRHRPRLGALPSTVACVSRVAFTGRARLASTLTLLPESFAPMALTVTCGGPFACRFKKRFLLKVRIRGRGFKPAAGGTVK